MPLPTVGDLAWLPALEHPELLAPGTHAALVAWAVVDSASRERSPWRLSIRHWQIRRH